MPWSASTLYAPALPDLKASWAQHPTLGPALHYFPQGSLKNCQLPPEGLLAVPEILPPCQCRFGQDVPDDSLYPDRPFCGAPLTAGPPSPMLAFLVEQSQRYEVPLLFYECQMHGGDIDLEVGWLVQGKKVQRCSRDPWWGPMRELGVRMPETGWFEPHTSRFCWRDHHCQLMPAHRTLSLYQAAYRQEWSVLRQLLEEGRSPIHYRRRSPLHWAVYHGNREAVDQLLALGAPIAGLELQVCSDPVLLERLLQAGAQPTPWSVLGMMKNAAGECYRRLERLVSLRPGEAFLAACEGGLLEFMEQWYRVDPQVLHWVDLGESALSLATRKGRLEAVQWLLQRGLNWDVQCLGEAAEGGHLPLLSLALEAGVSPAQDHLGRLPLARAAKEGHLAAMEALVRAGAEVRQPDPFGGTALHAAIQGECREAAEWLLQRGAEVGACDQSGHPPLWTAVGIDNQEMVDLLLAWGAPVEVVNHFGVPLSRLLAEREVVCGPSASP